MTNQLHKESIDIAQSRAVRMREGLETAVVVGVSVAAAGVVGLAVGISWVIEKFQPEENI